MIDANQVWEVSQAIDWVQKLAFVKPWFIEEPTSPDDIEGHRAIREGVHPVKVATGEMCQNRIIFKQLIMRGAIDVVQVDACRLGGLNELLAVLLMAAKYKLPVCPHAGGVGLCEYVQHASMIDYLCIAGTREGRVIARQELSLRVERVGTAADIASLARGQPLLYGVLCIVLAALAGWLGSVLFRRN
jgi:L-fuconate dehydratase